MKSWTSPLPGRRPAAYDGRLPVGEGPTEEPPGEPRTASPAVEPYPFDLPGLIL